MRQLDSLKQEKPDWQASYYASSGPSLTHARGNSQTVETTALAALAMLKVGGYSDNVNRALTYLLKSKHPNGTWGSTAATVLSLRALVRGMDAPADQKKTGSFVIRINGKEAGRGEINAENSEVVRFFDLAEHTQPGKNEIVIQPRGEAGMMYQIVARHYENWPAKATESAGLELRVDYDRKEVTTAQSVRARATLRHTGKTAADMVMVELGVPPGFRADASDFETMVRNGKIRRFNMTAQKVTLYLSRVEPSEQFVFEYRLRPLFPVQVRTPPSTAYEYYTPASRAVAMPVELKVKN
jgi:hypothetical protein